MKAAFYGRGRALEKSAVRQRRAVLRRSAGRMAGPTIPEGRRRRSWAEAGLASGFSCSLLATSTYGMIQSTAEVIQSNLAEIGIKASLVLPDWATRVAVGNRGQFDIAVNGTTNESNDPDGMSNFIETDLPNNYTRSFGLSAAADRRVGRGGPAHVRPGSAQGDLRRGGKACRRAGSDGEPVLGAIRAMPWSGSLRISPTCPAR